MVKTTGCVHVCVCEQVANCSITLIPSPPHPLTPHPLTPHPHRWDPKFGGRTEDKKTKKTHSEDTLIPPTPHFLTPSLCTPHYASLTLHPSSSHPLTLHPSSLPHLTSSPLTFHPSLLTPSLCIPHSLAPDPSLLIPHSSSPHSSLPHSASLTPHPLTLHPSLLTFSQSSQMEGLLTLVEEELNFSKKQSRSQIKAFVADQAKEQVCSPSSHTHTHSLTFHTPHTRETTFLFVSPILWSH